MGTIGTSSIRIQNGGLCAFSSLPYPKLLFSSMGLSAFNFAKMGAAIHAAKSRRPRLCEQPLRDEVFLLPKTCRVAIPHLQLPLVAILQSLRCPRFVFLVSRSWPRRSGLMEGEAIYELFPIFFGLSKAVVGTSDCQGELRGR